MQEDYAFFHPQNGSNIIKFITPPFKYNYHKHGFHNEVCFKHVSLSDCFLCLDNHNLYTKHVGWFVGVLSLSNNEKSILKMDISLFQQVANIARNSNYGDPMKHKFDLQFINNKYNLYLVFDTNIVSSLVGKDEELSNTCLKLIDPLHYRLSKVSSSRQFKLLYLSCKNSKAATDSLIELVNNEYSQYLDILKTCLIFS